MEAALVSVATGAMKPLLSKLSKLLEEEYSKLKGVHRQARFLRDEMCTMSGTLQALADSDELDPEIKIWRDNLRDLSYDMDDCVDRFTARVDQRRDRSTGIKKFFRKLKKLKSRHEIAGEIEELKARAIDISNRHKRYNIVKPSTPDSSCAIDPRLSALYVEVDKLVGIDAPKKCLTGEMESSSTQLKVVSVVGAGGLGKTTLANQVYQAIKGQFRCTAFVSVSRNPNTRRILRSIAEQVGVDLNTSDDDVKQLIDKLRDYLQDKRYFVVIDDLWDAAAWEIISLALLNNNQRSRIITTTRNVEVASCCSSQQGGYVYRMEPLSFANSKRLFYKRAFSSEDLCYPHLEEVSNEILKKCAGLPLAIITMSSLLADQSAKDEWERVLTAVGSAIAKDPNAGNMTKILSLGYLDLPHHLRACLLYLSAYPEDYVINKQCLVSSWVAEGFIQEELGRSIYEVGGGYFNDLINRSLIQPVGVKYGQAEACKVHDIILDFIRCKAAEENFVTSSDATESGLISKHKVGGGYFNDLINRSLIQPVGVKYGQAEACKVHDIILDFIRCKAAEENFVTSSDATESGLISKHKVRRLCIETSSNTLVTISTSLSHVRSFTVIGEIVQNSLLSLSVVRVLDLGECWWLEDHHIAEILKLSLLKYLNLGKSSIVGLPREIGELQYLQTLDVRRIRTRELPSTIVNLQQLARLYVRQGTKFPYGVIGQMQSLEELEEYSVLSDEQLMSLVEFSQLTKLRTLKLVWYADGPDALYPESRGVAEALHCFMGSLMCSSKLHHLYFINAYSRGPDYRSLSLASWRPTVPCSLRTLHIEHSQIDEVPDWMGLLENLRELKLYVADVSQEDFAILGAMPALLFLELNIQEGANKRVPIAGFRSLKYLELKIVNGENWVEFEAGSMTKLDHLKMEFNVHEREHLNGPSDFGIPCLSALTRAEVSIHSLSDSSSHLTADEIARLIRTAVGMLPNRPTLSLIKGWTKEDKE